MWLRLVQRSVISAGQARVVWCGGVRGLHLAGLRTAPAHYATAGTWQRRKQSSPPHHNPFTLTMTGGSVYEPLLSPSSMAPVPLWNLPDVSKKQVHVRLYSTKPPSGPSTPTDENHNITKSTNVNIDKEEVVQVVQDEDKKEEKLSLVQKFKLMYKQYWYVLIPVHVVTSVVWYGSFFLAAKSGVDIVPILEKIGASEKILSHLRASNAGYYAIAYAMYKIATPARYTVTIGGTTLSINYLKQRGYIKPVPSKDQLKDMYEGKKEELIEKREEMKEKYQERKEKIVERREEMIQKYQDKRGRMVEKYQERKDDIVDKYQEKKGEMADRYQSSRDKIIEKKEQIKDKIDEKKERLENVKDNLRKRR